MMIFYLAIVFAALLLCVLGLVFFWHYSPTANAILLFYGLVMAFGFIWILVGIITGGTA